MCTFSKKMFTNEGVHTQLHTKINEVLFSEISLSVSIVPSTMLLYCCILYEIIYSRSINNSLVTGSPPRGFSKVLEKKHYVNCFITTCCHELFLSLKVFLVICIILHSCFHLIHTSGHMVEIFMSLCDLGGNLELSVFT